MTKKETTDKKEQKPVSQKHIFHLQRRLFLLVFAVAVLWQGLLLIDMRLGQYYNELSRTFKIILTIDGKTDNAVLMQMGEGINQKADVASVKLFSAKDGLEVVRRQNPQLAQSILLMGRSQMPAYFELRLVPTAVRNASSLAANLAAEYKGLTPHYNKAHAELVFATGLCVKLLRMAMLFAALLFLAFMFMVEAYPFPKSRIHLMSAVFSGLLAGVCAGAFFAVLIYPTGFLSEAIELFTTPTRQILILVFCGLFGWTLSKWQKF